MTPRNELSNITAKFTISLPYRICVKEGDLYELIEKHLNNAGKIIIYPFEQSGNSALLKRDRGSYVNSFRKIEFDITLPIQINQINFSEKDKQRPFWNIGSNFLNIFLLHCRTTSKQFWLHPLFLNGSNMSQILYAVQFVSDKKKVLYTENGTILGLGPIGVGINQQVWQKIRNDILQDIKPNIVDYHIEEARTAVFSESVESLIINIAVALEVFTSRFCFEFARKTGKETEPYFKCLSEQQGSFTVNYFKKIIPYLTSKNLDIENKGQYEQIDFLFRTRNKIVHEGKLFYKDDSDIEHIVDYEKAHQFFLSVTEVMKWLRNIDSAIAENLKCFIDT